MANPDWSVIDQYVKNLPPNSASIAAYERAKRWFNSRFTATGPEYDRFIRLVVNRLGV